MNLSQPIFYQSVTISIANPAVFSCKNHGLKEDNLVMFITDGALPSTVSANVWYWIISTGLTENQFEISATDGGTAISTAAGSQSGTHLMASDSNKGFRVSQESDR